MAKKARKPLKNNTTKQSNQVRYRTGRGFNRGAGLEAPPKLNIPVDNLLNSYDYNELVSFSRYFYLNSGIVKGAIDLKSLYSIGNAFKISSIIEDVNIRKQYNAFISKWSKNVTIKGDTLDSLLYDICISLDVDGDCFLVLTYTQNTLYPKLQHITGDRVTGYEIPKGSQYDNSNYTIDRGIIKNNLGYEVAYLVDGNIVKAENCIHVKDNNVYGGSRNIPLFSHAVRELKYREQIEQAELHAAKMASSIVLVEKNEDGGTNLNTDNDSLDQESYNRIPSEITKFQSGSILYMQSGDGSSIDTLDFQRPSPNWMEFDKRLVKNALVGAGIPYDIIEPDSTGVGVRSSLQIFDKVCRDRYDLLVQVFNNVMSYVLAFGIVYKDLPAVDDFDSITITQPIKASIDIGRDQKQLLSEYQAGVRLLDDLIIYSGLSKEDFIKEQYREKAMMLKAKADAEKEFGVTLA